MTNPCIGSAEWQNLPYGNPLRTVWDSGLSSWDNGATVWDFVTLPVWITECYD